MFYDGFDIHIFLQYPDIFYLPFFVQNDVGQSVTFAYPEIIEIVDKQGLSGRVKHIIVLTGVFLIEIEIFVKEINAHDAALRSFQLFGVLLFPTAHQQKARHDPDRMPDHVICTLFIFCSAHR